MPCSAFPVFSQRFAALPRACSQRVLPTPIPQPYWIARNHALAAELGLSLEGTDDPLLALFAGNASVPGVAPLAARYAGHQFGQYVPQLGDGRAVLLGDLPWGAAARAEIQLKGAGPTPFSRQGDGRAVLRSCVREYLASEAMHGLGIATTRALCLVGTELPVWREQAETAAVLTRVAPSFVRFGSFEVLAHSGQLQALQQLADFVIQHHYPACKAADNPYAALFSAVCAVTAQLVAQWQAVGFCHGVMNSDNMSILGLTLDYGPFGFLDRFDAAHRCNHSDYAGRYAYKQQPAVAEWNLQCLASALLPLVPEQSLLEILAGFGPAFDHAYLGLMRAKLGLQQAEMEDRQLVDALLLVLHASAIDFTIFFRLLSHGDLDRVTQLFDQPAAWLAWQARYLARLRSEALSAGERSQAMLKLNPKYVLRNYLAENAIALARDANDFSQIERLAACLAHPFDEQPAFDDYAAQPPGWARDICLSCSS